MPRLSQIDRERAIGMLNGGTSQIEVARQFGVTDRTIRYLQTRLRETGSSNDRPRSGRPRVTSAADDRYIRLSHLRRRSQPATSTARTLPGRARNRISAQTVRRRLHRTGMRSRATYAGMPLTNARRLARHRWATVHARWRLQDWNNILFTDESRFCLDFHDGRLRTWRRTGERFDDVCVRERDRYGGGSVMVWGGISFGLRTELRFVNGTLTAQQYRDNILSPCVVPLARERNLIFQQDNARPHVARANMEYLAASEVEVLPWPAFSPDLSPIEHVWDVLGRAVRQRPNPPSTIAELRIALVEEWHRIPRNQIQRLITSMRRRCTAVVNANGGHTRY